MTLFDMHFNILFYYNEVKIFNWRR